MCLIGHEQGHAHGLGLLAVQARLDGARGGQQANDGLVAKLFLNFLHRHALHVDEGNAHVRFDARHKGVRRVAGHNQAIAPVGLQALGAVVHGQRRIVAAFQEALRAVRNLRVLLDDELEVFLVGLGGRGLDDLVVQVHRGRRPQTADHAHLKGLGKASGRSGQKLLGIGLGSEARPRLVRRVDQAHRKFGLQFFEERMRARAGKADHLGAGLFQALDGVKIVDLARGHLLGVRRVLGHRRKFARIENDLEGGIGRQKRRLDFEGLVAVMTHHQTNDFHLPTPSRKHVGPGRVVRIPAPSVHPLILCPSPLFFRDGATPPIAW